MIKKDLYIKNDLTIPHHELDITASRSGGPGGQHVNKTSSRITVRWNIPESKVLSEQQKERLLLKLAAALTDAGEFIVHNGESRSQLHNKEQALVQLAHTVERALRMPKKRVKTATTTAAKENRLSSKKQKSFVKKMRGKIDF